MAVYGTRPEAIKMAPVVLALQQCPDFAVDVVVTGQHREMLDQVNATFGIVPTDNLNIHSAGQTLTSITCRSLSGLEPLIERRRPDAVLAQGDTTTVFAASLAAFYAKVPVIHLEAGLRTTDRYSPYPEEINRRLTTRLASLHAAPTWNSRDNLLRENVSPESIYVTGNTVIDALLWTVSRPVRLGDPVLCERLAPGRPMLLVTAHRRESWGEPMRGIGRALATIARRHPEFDIVLPLHPNPLVRQAILPAIEGHTNVIVTEPLPYVDFCHVMNRSSIILTDSGGVQEEGPSLGKPVLVMRENTERPEAVDAGTARLVGTDEAAIVEAVGRLIEDTAEYERMATAVNPYGDGQASGRLLQAIQHHFGLAERPAPFRPSPSPIGVTS